MPNSISVGVHDWTLFPACGHYYPPDLPREWRLSYFANEFDSACLNLDVLLCREKLLHQWCEDLKDSFELSFKLNDINQLPVLSRLQQETDVFIKFLVVDSSVDEKLLHREIVQSVSCSAGGQVISASELWIPERQQFSGARVAAFPVSDSLREYRYWIDAWVEGLSPETGDSELTLWLPGDLSSSRLLEDCRTLVEMMGY